MYRGFYLKASTKLTSFEDLAKSTLNLRYQMDNEPYTIEISGEQVIRHFASALSAGLSQEELEAETWQLIRARVTDADHLTVHRRTYDDISLFFEVFEIAEWKYVNNERMLSIKKDKKYLLKAAFKPLGEVADEIPF